MEYGPPMAFLRLKISFTSILPVQTTFLQHVWFNILPLHNSHARGWSLPVASCKPIVNLAKGSGATPIACSIVSKWIIALYLGFCSNVHIKSYKATKIYLLVFTLHPNSNPDKESGATIYIFTSPKKIQFCNAKMPEST